MMWPIPKRALSGVIAFMLVATLALSACSGKAEIKEWNATVEVNGTSATVFVTVPGARIGPDYHPHLRLNGGPEVMMYTPSYTFSNLRPGSYRVLVQLAEPGHDPIPGLEKELAFEIR